MPVQFLNYEYSYNIGNGKPVFVPTDRGRELGLRIKELIERNFDPDIFFYHLKPGGHVAALHAHRNHLHFARIDIENFFYSIGRNRVTRALHEIGVPTARTYAKWSCVKNPYNVPAYSLPYGFVQSPLLATLVLANSEVGAALRKLMQRLTVSVFVDDISLSGDDPEILGGAYSELLRIVQVSGFSINAIKSKPPAARIDVFNCHLRHNSTIVTEDRRIKFYSEDRSVASIAGFERYCDAVAGGR